MRTIGIYSYPRSGNTWMRTIVSAAMGMLRDGIPDLHQNPLSTAVPFNGVRAYKHHGGEYVRTAYGEEVPTTHVIHIRRNPLDVFMSYLNFLSDNVTGYAPIRFGSVDEIAGTDLFDGYFKSFVVLGHMSLETDFSAVTKGYFPHQKFWLEQAAKGKPVKALRYEDLKDDSAGTLSFLKDWMGITDEGMAEALDLAEKRTKPNGKFFWRKESGTWQEYLSREHVEFLIRYRKQDMIDIGYPPDQFLDALR